MEVSALTRHDFISFWGDGYYDERGIGDLLFAAAIKPFADRNKMCLEIGCGAGYWINNYLRQSFGRVIGIDVIPKPKTIRVEYFELNDGDYTCGPIEDESIDFVWCYDVFCHLPNSAVRQYLTNVIRVLRRGGSASLGFANWKTHPSLCGLDNGRRYREVAHADGWFYMDGAIVASMFETLEIPYQNLLPQFRDTIVHFQKPCV